MFQISVTGRRRRPACEPYTGICRLVGFIVATETRADRLNQRRLMEILQPPSRSLPSVRYSRDNRRMFLPVNKGRGSVEHVYEQRKPEIDGRWQRRFAGGNVAIGRLQRLGARRVANHSKVPQRCVWITGLLLRMFRPQRAPHDIIQQGHGISRQIMGSKVIHCEKTPRK